MRMIGFETDLLKKQEEFVAVLKGVTKNEDKMKSIVPKSCGVWITTIHC